MEELEFYKEAVKGQTFIGQASFSYQPKTNVINFIEDLGLAGIRFVYFSPAPGNPEVNIFREGI